MSLRSSIRNAMKPWMQSYPHVKKWLGVADRSIDRVRHSVATHLPMVIKPVIRNVTVAITAHCNLRCVGCRYGRDFMVGSQLPWPMMKDLLTDAKNLGVEFVRLYGGEPLLHPDLPRMIEYCTQLRLATYITTNGILLKEKIDALYEAGLRDITIGFYGNGRQYDDYVQRRNSFERMEEGIATVRDRYGLNVNIRMNWLLMRPTCNHESLSAAWNLAQRYNMKFQVDLIHYSLPYFSEGHDRELQFSAHDKPAIKRIVDELISLKQDHPNVFSQSLSSIKSIPDWLVKGPDMRVPCDAYDMIWVGADGTVQLCYVTFKLGNLHANRLQELVYTAEHTTAARGAFSLNCPNCHCHYGARIDKQLFMSN